jgi:hypothetical protein
MTELSFEDGRQVTQIQRAMLTFLPEVIVNRRTTTIINATQNLVHHKQGDEDNRDAVALFNEREALLMVDYEQ